MICENSKCKNKPNEADLALQPPGVLQAKKKDLWLLDAVMTQSGANQ